MGGQAARASSTGKQQARVPCDGRASSTGKQQARVPRDRGDVRARMGDARSPLHAACVGLGARGCFAGFRHFRGRAWRLGIQRSQGRRIFLCLEAQKGWFIKNQSKTHPNSSYALPVTVIVMIPTVTTTIRLSHRNRGQRRIAYH